MPYNQGMRTQFRLNTRLLPAIVLVLVIMQFIDPSRVWMIFLVGLGGLWMIAYVWARSLASRLSVIREMRYGWVQVGDVLEERFTLKNRGWWPATWVEIEDQSTLPGYDASQATGVDGSGARQWRVKGTCNRRGLYQLGGTSMLTGDPFGVHTIRIEDPAHATLMVMPPIVPLPPLQITPGGYSGEGHPIPNAPERTVDASSVREYIPGDSLKKVHWKTTARHGKPYVRRFDGAPAGDWWILLDLQSASHIYLEDDSTQEHGIILAASLADHGLRAHRGVGLVVNGDRLDWLPPRTSGGQRWEILRALALASDGETPLAEVLEHVRPNLGRNSSLIIITATARMDWLERLPHLHRRGIKPTVFLLEQGSFDERADNSNVANELARMHVTCYTIPREFLDRPEARPGTRGQVEWKISPTGRAIPVRASEAQSWRRLAE
jgi:uncharacterized protein (DUF58 family)